MTPGYFLWHVSHLGLTCFSHIHDSLSLPIIPGPNFLFYLLFFCPSITPTSSSRFLFFLSRSVFLFNCSFQAIRYCSKCTIQKKKEQKKKGVRKPSRRTRPLSVTLSYSARAHHAHGTNTALAASAPGGPRARRFAGVAVGVVRVRTGSEKERKRIFEKLYHTQPLCPYKLHMWSRGGG